MSVAITERHGLVLLRSVQYKKECKNRAMQYGKMLLFSIKYLLEDPFDIEGMRDAILSRSFRCKAENILIGLPASFQRRVRKMWQMYLSGLSLPISWATAPFDRGLWFQHRRIGGKNGHKIQQRKKYCDFFRRIAIRNGKKELNDAYELGKSI